MIWRPKNYQLWRRWFAWYPVELENGDRAWLEIVERRKWYMAGYDFIMPIHIWMYRSVGDKKKYVYKGGPLV